MSSTMIMNLILIISMYPLIVIIFLVQKGSANQKNGKKMFGIAYEDEWLPENRRKEIQNQYNRTMKRCLIVLLLFPVVIFPIPYMSISLTLWCAWIYGSIILFMIPYMKKYQELYTYKQQAIQEKRMADLGENTVQYTEIKAAGKLRTLRVLDFLPQALLSILAVTIAAVKWYDTPDNLYIILIVTFASCTFVFWLCAAWMDGIKTTVISHNSDVNLNYSRAKKQIWKNVFRFMAWVNTFFVWMIAGVVLGTEKYADLAYSVIVWGSVLESIILLVIVYWAWKKCDVIERLYDSEKNMDNNSDEKYWIGGVFYNNPKDRHTMVPKQVGIGTACNLATPGGKVFVVVAILGLLIAPISCVWAMVDEFTPISLTCQNQVITARQVKKDYEIPVDSIVHISMQEEVPQGRRMKGTGMDNLLKGTFNNREEGRVQFFFNPQNHVFLRVETEDQIYYLSGYDDAQTREVYEEIGEL